MEEAVKAKDEEAVEEIVEESTRVAIGEETVKDKGKNRVLAGVAF